MFSNTVNLHAAVEGITEHHKNHMLLLGHHKLLAGAHSPQMFVM